MTGSYSYIFKTLQLNKKETYPTFTMNSWLFVVKKTLHESDDTGLDLFFPPDLALGSKVCPASNFFAFMLRDFVASIAQTSLWSNMGLCGRRVSN